MTGPFTRSSPKASSCACRPRPARRWRFRRAPTGMAISWPRSAFRRAAWGRSRSGCRGPFAARTRACTRSDELFRIEPQPRWAGGGSAAGPRRPAYSPAAAVAAPAVGTAWRRSRRPPRRGCACRGRDAMSRAIVMVGALAILLLVSGCRCATLSGRRRVASERTGCSPAREWCRLRLRPSSARIGAPPPTSPPSVARALPRRPRGPGR